MPLALLQIYQRTGLQSAVRATGLLKLVAPGMAKAEALMPELADRERVLTVGKTYPAEGERVGTVAFFTGCVMNSMLGSINRASVRLLNAAGYDVVVPNGQVCCGALANHAGLRDTAVEAAKRNVAAFSDPDIEAIMINAAGCGAMLKEYPHICGRRCGFSSKVKDISEFLATTRLASRLKVLR